MVGFYVVVAVVDRFDWNKRYSLYVWKIVFTLVTHIAPLAPSYELSTFSKGHFITGRLTSFMIITSPIVSMRVVLSIVQNILQNETCWDLFLLTVITRPLSLAGSSLHFLVNIEFLTASPPFQLRWKFKKVVAPQIMTDQRGVFWYHHGKILIFNPTS